MLLLPTRPTSCVLPLPHAPVGGPPSGRHGGRGEAQADLHIPRHAEASPRGMNGGNSPPPTGPHPDAETPPFMRLSIDPWSGMTGFGVQLQPKCPDDFKDGVEVRAAFAGKCLVKAFAG